MSLNFEDLENVAPAAAPAAVPAPKVKKSAVKKEAGIPPTDVLAKKKRRFKSGTRALMEIRKYQRSDKPVVPRAPLKRLVLEILHELHPEFRLSSVSVDALRDIAESEMTKTFSLASELDINIGRRKTLTAKAFKMAARLIRSPEATAAGGCTVERSLARA